MKKNIKIILGITLGIIIGASTIVYAATIFRSKDITYSNSATTKTNVKDSLDELYSKVGKCPDNNLCYDISNTLANEVELGDYISMIPTSTSYTPPEELTGCMNDENCIQNTINPSELNIWRVIRKNIDGTVEVVSDKISSKDVYFYGKTGYMNFVGGLNVIAAQYIDGKHVQSARHVGYSNQMEKCTLFTRSECPSDTGYRTDFQLISEAFGGKSDCREGCSLLVANKVGESTPSMYFIASRYVDDKWAYCGRYSYLDGGSGDGLLGFGTIANVNEREYKLGFPIRPILKLSSTSEISSGDGSLQSPFILTP